jgi:hypothetical protein
MSLLLLFHGSGEGGGDAVTATTWCTIRDALSAAFIAATPGVLPAYGFDHANKRYPIEMWAGSLGANSTLLRRFQWRRANLEQPAYLDAGTVQWNETSTLTITYPVLPALYGNADLDEIERVMRRDAKQLRDIIASPGQLVSGQEVGRVSVLEPETAGPVWYQRLTVLFVYQETQVLA